MPSQQTNERARPGGQPHPAAGAPAAPSDVAVDRLSLEQALRDFEVANRRVVDLTQRLLDATDEARALRTELETLRIAHNQLLVSNHEAHLALQGLHGSRAYTVVRAARAARRLLGR